MKTLKYFLIGILLVTIAYSCNTTKSVSRAVDPTVAVVIYTSDDANNITAAALVGVKYSNVMYIDIDGMDSADIDLVIADIDSAHRIFVLPDTAPIWADNQIAGPHYDTLVTRLMVDTAFAVAPDTIIQVIAASATKSKAELVWEDVYPTFTKPKIVENLGSAVFSTKRNITKFTSTDSTIVDTTGSMTVDLYIGQYAVITTGTGFGQSRLITDNDATKIYVTPDWNTRPSQAAYYIKASTQTNEIFYDQYAKFYILGFLRDLADEDVIDNWHKLVDSEYNINDGNVVRAPFQDLNYLNNTVLSHGKIIFDYNYAVAYPAGL